GYALVDPEVREVVGRAVRVFERDLGCIVEEAHPGWEDPFAHFFTIVLVETDLKGMRRLVRQYGSQIMPPLVEALKMPLTDEVITDAIMARKAVTNKAWRFFRQYDLVLTPTTAVAPFTLGIQGPETIEGKEVSPAQWLPFTFPF